MTMEYKLCETCGQPITKNRHTNARFCSHACKRYMSQRKGEVDFAVVSRLHKDGGLSVRQIAEQLKSTKSIVSACLLRRGQPSGVSTTTAYHGLHRRLTKQRGAAKLYPCSQCGQPAQEWANLTGQLDDLADYAPMCRNCHALYDAQRRFYQT